MLRHLADVMRAFNESGGSASFSREALKSLEGVAERVGVPRRPISTDETAAAIAAFGEDYPHAEALVATYCNNSVAAPEGYVGWVPRCTSTCREMPPVQG